MAAQEVGRCVIESICKSIEDNGSLAFYCQKRKVHLSKGRSRNLVVVGVGGREMINVYLKREIGRSVNVVYMNDISPLK